MDILSEVIETHKREKEIRKALLHSEICYHCHYDDPCFSVAYLDKSDHPLFEVNEGHVNVTDCGDYSDRDVEEAKSLLCLHLGIKE